MANIFTNRDKDYEWRVLEKNRRIAEKYEERRQPEKINIEQVPKLPITNQDCVILLNILGKIALQQQNLRIIKAYLELENRIQHGNLIPYPADELQEYQTIDKEIWEIFSGNSNNREWINNISITFEEYQILLGILKSILEKEPNEEILNVIQDIDLILLQSPNEGTPHR